MEWEAAAWGEGIHRPPVDLGESWPVTGELSNKECLLEESHSARKWTLCFCSTRALAGDSPGRMWPQP